MQPALELERRLHALRMRLDDDVHVPQG
jgi:hypothetical protein